jgi:hypothetical protein
LQRDAAGRAVQTIVEHMSERSETVTGCPIERYVVGHSRKQVSLRLEHEEVIPRASAEVLDRCRTAAPVEAAGPPEEVDVGAKGRAPTADEATAQTESESPTVWTSP